MVENNLLKIKRLSRFTEVLYGTKIYEHRLSKGYWKNCVRLKDLIYGRELFSLLQVVDVKE
jgi:hypothetical protein